MSHPYTYTSVPYENSPYCPPVAATQYSPQQKYGTTPDQSGYNQQQYSTGADQNGYIHQYTAPQALFGGQDHGADFMKPRIWVEPFQQSYGTGPGYSNHQGGTSPDQYDGSNYPHKYGQHPNGQQFQSYPQSQGPYPTQGDTSPQQYDGSNYPQTYGQYPNGQQFQPYLQFQDPYSHQHAPYPNNTSHLYSTGTGYSASTAPDPTTTTTTTTAAAAAVPSKIPTPPQSDPAPSPASHQSKIGMGRVAKAGAEALSAVAAVGSFVLSGLDFSGAKN